MTYQDTIVDVIDTNATKKPQTPQVTIENPLKKDIFVNFIQLSFDTYFSDKGIITIKIGNRYVLKQNKVGSYKRLKNLPISLSNELFYQGEKITIYAWNGLDSDFVSVGYDIGISEQPNAQTPTDTPLSISQRNQEKSEPSELFPFRIYHEDDLTQPETALIDMKGHKKLIVTMAGSEVQEATIETDFVANPDSVQYTIQGGSLVPASDSYENSAILDTQDDEAKKITFTIGSTPVTALVDQKAFQVDDGTGNGWNHYEADLDMTRTITWTVEESDDIGFTAPTTLYDEVSQATLLSAMPFDTTKRYLRITQHIAISFNYSETFISHSNGSSSGCIGCGTFNVNYNQTPAVISDIINTLTQGGTGFLSFEVKGVSEQWVEFISSAEFGTITQGSSVVKQIGDVVSQSNQDKVGFVLPSTQTDFRAKLVVTGGGIQTGVRVLRVS